MVGGCPRRRSPSSAGTAPAARRSRPPPSPRSMQLQIKIVSQYGGDGGGPASRDRAPGANGRRRAPMGAGRRGREGGGEGGRGGGASAGTAHRVGRGGCGRVARGAGGGGHRLLATRGWVSRAARRLPRLPPPRPFSPPHARGARGVTVTASGDGGPQPPPPGPPGSPGPAWHRDPRLRRVRTLAARPGPFSPFSSLAPSPPAGCPGGRGWVGGPPAHPHACLGKERPAGNEAGFELRQGGRTAATKGSICKGKKKLGKAGLIKKATPIPETAVLSRNCQALSVRNTAALSKFLHALHKVRDFHHTS